MKWVHFYEVVGFESFDLGRLLSKHVSDFEKCT